MNTTPTSTKDHTSKTVEIDCQDACPVSLAFTPDGREIVSSERYTDRPGGRLRRFKVTGENPNQRAQVLVDTADVVGSVVVSKDGRWIVSVRGMKVAVRNTTTNEEIWVDKDASEVHAIDVSPDSMRFASGSEDKTVSIFSITTGRSLLGPFKHHNRVFGVKFSPNGERLATAEFVGGNFVRVWDAHTGEELFESHSSPARPGRPGTIEQAAPIGWSGANQLVFVMPPNFLRAIEVPPSNKPHWRGQTVPANTNNDTASLSLALTGRFVACSAGGSLSFWDTFSQKQIGPLIRFLGPIHCIAISSDGCHLACGTSDKGVIIYALRDILPLTAILDPTSDLPLMNIADAAFKPWIEQDLERAHSVLSGNNYSHDHHMLANRALVRAHLRANYYHSNAIEDANNSLSIQPSVIGHIAKASVLLSQGKNELAVEAFDVAFRDCGANQIRFLLLLKAIFLFVSGKREYAITRVNDLIAVADDCEMYTCLQVLANMHLMQGDSERTMQAFERAQSLSFSRQGFHLVTILLIFGRSFEELEITIRRPLRGINAA